MNSYQVLRDRSVAMSDCPLILVHNLKIFKENLKRELYKENYVPKGPCCSSQCQDNIPSSSVDEEASTTAAEFGNFIV